MSGKNLDLIGLILFIAFFIAGLTWPGNHRLILFALAILVGGSLGYAAEVHNGAADPPAMTAFFVAIMFIIDILIAMFIRFLIRLIWR
jgi:hypothetical protein